MARRPLLPLPNYIMHPFVPPTAANAPCWVLDPPSLSPWPGDHAPYPVWTRLALLHPAISSVSTKVALFLSSPVHGCAACAPQPLRRIVLRPPGPRLSQQHTMLFGIKGLDPALHGRGLALASTLKPVSCHSGNMPHASSSRPPWLLGRALQVLGL